MNPAKGFRVRANSERPTTTPHIRSAPPLPPQIYRLSHGENLISGTLWCGGGRAYHWFEGFFGGIYLGFRVGLLVRTRDTLDSTSRRQSLKIGPYVSYGLKLGLGAIGGPVMIQDPGLRTPVIHIYIYIYIYIYSTTGQWAVGRFNPKP